VTYDEQLIEYMKLNPEQAAAALHTDGPAAVIGAPGCLAGETEISYLRGKRHGGRKICLEELFLKFNGMPSRRKAWEDLSEPTYTYSLGSDGTSYYNKIEAVIYSGMKPCVKVVTDRGHELVCTSDHKFLLPDLSYAAAGELRGGRSGSEVMMLGSMKPNKGAGRTRKGARVIVDTKYHPYGWLHVVHAVERMQEPKNYTYRRVPRARLVLEAAMNGVSYAEFVHVLKTDARASSKFRYLDHLLQVHHKDEDKLNDSIDNLQPMTCEAHSREHGKTENFNVEYYRKERVVSISRVGTWPTFDISMQGPDHNFAANGFFVHNSGKTKTIIARIARLVALGVPPSGILAMTFTRTAAAEMQQRLEALGLRGARVGTIHSVCSQILEVSASYLVSGLELDTNDRLKWTLQGLLGDLRKENAIPKREVDVNEVWRAISRIKTFTWAPVHGDPFRSRTFRDPFETACQAFCRKTGMGAGALAYVFEQFEERRAARCQYGFDDMLLWAWYVLRTDPEALYRWRSIYAHVIVDECFDGRTPVTLPDGTQRSIRDLVDSRYAGPILSYNLQTRQMEPRAVTGWHKIPLAKKMVRVVARRQGFAKDGSRLGPLTERVRFGLRYLLCTEDQLVLRGVGSSARMVPAAELQAGDVLTLESEAPKAPEYAKAAGHGIAGRQKLAQLMREKNRGGSCGGAASGGYIPVRGGNGAGPSPTELSVQAKLGAGWLIGHSIPTGFVPHHYKIDVANPDLMIAIELDGSSHMASGRQQADARKDQRLQELGWTVVRLRNKDALRMSSCEILQLTGIESAACPIPAEVVSVEEWQPADAFVYDIDVEGTHTFLADGLVVHNCQDSNPVQWDIAALIAGWPPLDLGAMAAPAERCNLMVAGDVSQSIFGFQNGTPALTSEFVKVPGVSVYPLPVNYRSVPGICEASYQIVKDRPWHLVGPIRAVRESTGQAVRVVPCASGAEEAALAVKECREYAEGNGWDFSKCAILARLSVDLYQVELECIRQRITYLKRAAGSFVESKEVTDILAYLRVACGCDPEGRWLRHIINTPFRFISKKTITAAEEIGRERGISLLDQMLEDRSALNRPQRMAMLDLQRLLVRLNKAAAAAEGALLLGPPPAEGVEVPQPDGPEDLIADILLTTDYVEELRRHEGLSSMDESRQAVIGALQRIAREFKSVMQFIAYVDGLSVALKQAKHTGLRAKDGEQSNALVLSTIHRAKGLEWGHVNLVGISDGTFPSSRTDDPDEELRLLFVAVSRAADSCTASYIQSECSEGKPAYAEILGKKTGS